MNKRQEIWPDPPIPESTDSQFTVELKKMLYQAKLDACKAQRQAEIDKDKIKFEAGLEQHKGEIVADLEREKAAYANEYLLGQAVHSAYIEVSKGQVTAPIARAEFVQKAATAISAAYIAVLGLSFGVGQNNVILPTRGILPTVFLGLSIFLATAYSAYVTEPGAEEGQNQAMEEKSEEGTLVTHQIERRNTFIEWTRSAALSRKYLMQVAIVSLGFAVTYLPAPYISLNDQTVLFLAILGIGCSLIIPLLISLASEIKGWFVKKTSEGTQTPTET